MAILQRVPPPNGASKTKGYEKIAIFDQYLTRTAKDAAIVATKCESEWETTLSNGAIFNDLERSTVNATFKVTPLFAVNISETVRAADIVTTKCQ